MLSFLEYLVLFIYTISIGIICVSQEECSPTGSNQQIHDFYKKVIFESTFLISVNYSFNIIQIATVSTQQMVLTYIHVDVSVYLPLSVLFVCVCCCVCYQIRVPPKNQYYVPYLNKLDTLQLILITSLSGEESDKSKKGVRR